MTSTGFPVFRGSDGGWHYAAPDDRFVRITGPDHLLARVPELVAGDPADEGLSELAEALRERGVLPRTEPTVVREPRVRVTGDGPVAEQLTKLLGDTVTRGVLDEESVAAADVVVSCADQLPDRAWQEIDRWCVRYGTPWHRCHAEPGAVAIGPFFLPGRSASYVDTRGRRLAASATPDELAALWRHLESGEPVPRVDWPMPLTAVVAGLLAADITAYAAGIEPPSLGHQLVLTTTTFTLTRHPVLPLPDLELAR